MTQDPFSPETLRTFLENECVVTLDDLKQALGTAGTMTVFRKLKALGYLSSYSHRGKYYTLHQIPAFDEQGLWNWHTVWFSRYGNLVETAREFVDTAESGLTARELGTILHVECKRALLKLVRDDRLARDRIGGAYVYLAKHRGRQRQQRLRRQEQVDDLVVPALEVLSDELRAAIILFFSLLDEQQRRLYAGLESQKLGHGGDRKIAELLGLDEHTVARGRRQLFSSDVERDRVRRSGGGRQATEKKGYIRNPQRVMVACTEGNREAFRGYGIWQGSAQGYRGLRRTGRSCRQRRRGYGIRWLDS